MMCRCCFVFSVLCLVVSIYHCLCSGDAGITRVISERCLDSLCMTLTSCSLPSNSSTCLDVANSEPQCGFFLLTQRYWEAAGMPGIRTENRTTDFLACANDKNCSRATVRHYLLRNAQDYDGNGEIRCSEFAQTYFSTITDQTPEKVIDSPFWYNSFHFFNPDIRRLSRPCLFDICTAASNCTNRGCVTENGTAFCGPFRLNEEYWDRAGRPQEVRDYMSRNGRDCDGNERLDCDDFAAIHVAGPATCDRVNETRSRSPEADSHIEGDRNEPTRLENRAFFNRRIRQQVLGPTGRCCPSRFDCDFLTWRCRPTFPSSSQESGERCKCLPP